MADAIVAPAICGDIKHSLNFDCGIYAIIAPSGRRYIGQAQSFKARWRGHRRDLRKGIHKCKPLQNAWDKYGEDSFTFSRIAIVPVDQLNVREQEQFDEYVKDGKRGFLYNVTLCAEVPMRGMRMTDEQKLKMSAAKKGKYSGENNPNWGKRRSEESRLLQSESRKGKYLGINSPSARSVICVETLMKFDTLTDAQIWLRENGKPRADKSAISVASRTKNKTAYGYTWRLVGDPDMTSLVERGRKGVNSPFSKPVVCVELERQFHGISEAARWLHENGHPRASLHSISQVCRGKRKTCYGYSWRYA